MRGQHTLSGARAGAPKMASGIGGGRRGAARAGDGLRGRPAAAGAAAGGAAAGGSGGGGWCGAAPMVHRGQWPGDYQDWQLYHHGPGSTSSQWATFLNSAPHYGFLGKEPPALRTTTATAAAAAAAAPPPAPSNPPVFPPTA